MFEFGKVIYQKSTTFPPSNLHTTSQSIYFLERLGASSGQVGERSAPGKVQNGAISLSQLIFVPHYGHRVRSVTAFAAVDNGFDTLVFQSTITEEDLKLLGFKLGHKRPVWISSFSPGYAVSLVKL
jgi:hypothetical protein